MSSCQDRIKIPGDSEVRQEPLHYIKIFYETLYKTETPDNNAISDITKDLPHIQQEENTNLEKEIRIQPLSKIEEVFTPTTNIERRDMEAIIWMNTIIIYELWCIYTSYKWGKETLSNEAATARATSRIKKEVSDLQSHLGKSSKRRAKRFKCIKC
ncbi:25576_t:CDS:2 [Dentiscutata erythropus]|uniref:25576_t:CDS:1 n=1 Tax=Dentiscutata erythropus TaxID=1348616 RepID=A0A9N9C8P6_9GLOM|nr:25576_t:CDS:2 [Dentiscutata erythropus]